MATVICRELSNGVKIPALNLGTYRLNDITAPAVVDAACRAGYRGFDCADFYKNEDIIGPLISEYESGAKALGVTNAPRCFRYLPGANFVAHDNFDQTFQQPHGPCKNRIFVTTKIWPSDYQNDIAEIVRRHLKNFKREMTDLVLMHWPGPHRNWGFTSEEQMDAEANAESRIKVWKQLEVLYHDRKIRAIGVSNFMPKHLLPLIRDIEARKVAGDSNATSIMINQVEGSPWIQGFRSVKDICLEHRIAISAYRPLGGDVIKYGRICQDDVSSEIAKKYDVPKASVLIRWLLQNDLIVLPKSASPDRVCSNRDVFSFELENEEMEQLNQLHVADANLHENPNDIG